MGYFKRSLAQSMTLIPSWARRPLVLIPFVGAFYFAAPMYKAAITASREVVQQEVDALSIELQAATDLTVDRTNLINETQTEPLKDAMRANVVGRDSDALRAKVASEDTRDANHLVVEAMVRSMYREGYQEVSVDEELRAYQRRMSDLFRDDAMRANRRLQASRARIESLSARHRARELAKQREAEADPIAAVAAESRAAGSASPGDDGGAPLTYKQLLKEDTVESMKDSGMRGISGGNSGYAETLRRQRMEPVAK